MPSGLLMVEGLLDVSQFWPDSSSDADTIKVSVDLGSEPFKFRPHPGAEFAVTHAFDDATVKGATTKPAIQRGKLVIRLQGVDAPELHYRPVAVLTSKKRNDQQSALWKKWCHEFRQALGETATVGLGAKLKEFGKGEIPCRVETAVDAPDDAFDTYGRMVGDVIIPEGNDFNVNEWLAAEGWAFPTFYASMTPAEIDRLTTACEGARSAQKGVWARERLPRSLEDNVFDFNLRYRAPAADEAPDEGDGRTLMPKLFRRLSTWATNRKAKMVSGNFTSYLEERPDELHLRDEFMEQGATAAPIYHLSEFIGSGGTFKAKPQDLVFREKPSRLVGPNGKPVSW